jgi:hypothetical protein
MAGAVAGTPGTLPTNWALSTNDSLSTQVVGTGVENGINYIDIRYFGITSGAAGQNINLDNTTAIVAAYGQTWIQSLFIRLSAGSLSNISSVALAISERTSGGAATGTNHASSSIASSLSASSIGSNRQSFQATLTNSTAGALLPQITIGYSSSVAIDVTLRIGWPQLENNSLINSTVASATIGTAGSGGTAGTAVYSIGGGSGTTTATLNITIAGGVLSAINSVANAGSYTTFPPSPATLTYVSGTGTGLTGATVNLTPTNNAALAAASNPILTTSAAVTRAAEVDTLVLTGLPGFGSAYTIYARGTPATPTGYPNPQFPIQADDGTSTNRAFLRREGATGNGTWRGIGGAGWNISATTLTQSASVKLAGAATTSDQAYYDNASQIGTASAATLPSGINTVHLGCDAGNSNQFNGNLEEIAIWFTQRVPNATLQAITT